MQVQPLVFSCGVDSEEIAHYICKLHFYRCAYFSVLLEKINVYNRYLIQIDSDFGKMNRSTLELYKNLRVAHNLFVSNIQRIINDILPPLRILNSESDTRSSNAYFTRMDELFHLFIFFNEKLEHLTRGWNVERCLAAFDKSMDYFIYTPVPPITPYDASLPQQVTLLLLTLEELQKKCVFYSREVKK
jgi:hypothetical protein